MWQIFRESNINVVGNWRMPVFGRFEWESNIIGGSRGGSELNEIW